MTDVPSQYKLDAQGLQLTQVKTATIGRPALVHLAKMRGAWPRTARPYKIREAVYKNELPAENAEVKTQALII